MSEMRLTRLTLRNFKGISEFILDAQGENVTVYCDNAAGKTTLFDAFTWLLFDKDSQNRKDFAIKTLDAAGQVVLDGTPVGDAVDLGAGEERTM